MKIKKETLDDLIKEIQDFNALVSPLTFKVNPKIKKYVSFMRQYIQLEIKRTEEITKKVKSKIYSDQKEKDDLLKKLQEKAVILEKAFEDYQKDPLDGSRTVLQNKQRLGLPEQVQSINSEIYMFFWQTIV